MHVSAIAALRSIDVSVCVNPDDGDLSAEAFTGGFGRARDGADGNAVVATQRESHAPGSRVLVRLRGDLSRHGGNGAWVLHVPVRRVGGWGELGVEVHRVMAVQFVT